MENFEWDEKKRLSNVAKHHIDFVDAIFVFDDFDRIEFENQGNGEVRYETIGKVNGYILFVVYTYREHKRRIISARIASCEERRLYVDLGK